MQSDLASTSPLLHFGGGREKPPHSFLCPSHLAPLFLSSPCPLGYKRQWLHDIGTQKLVTKSLSRWLPIVYLEEASRIRPGTAFIFWLFLEGNMILNWVWGWHTQSPESESSLGKTTSVGVGLFPPHNSRSEDLLSHGGTSGMSVVLITQGWMQIFRITSSYLENNTHCMWAK